jgi:hypothetical protein
MENLMSKVSMYLLMSLLISQSVFADVLVVGKTRNKGTFKGFANNIFELEQKGGKTLKINRTKVKTLELDKPAKVSYLQRGKKEVRDAELLRYEKFKFSFTGKKKETHVIGSVMKKITISWSSSGTGGGPASSNIPTAPPALDLSGIEGADLTPDQETTLASYKSAREDYDKFLNENTALVKQMDAETHGAREKLLNELRIRKQNEQPLRIALQKATDDVLATFPPPAK